MDDKTINIVSGLPRSGTSMMMKMLFAGGMSAFIDNIRKADEDNKQGYYELEIVKKLENDISFLEEAKGKSVKIISALLKHLPEKYQYKIIFMKRDLDEVLASQKQMLIRRGEPTDQISSEKMKEIFLKHLQQVEDWLSKQSNIKVLYANYKDFFVEPEVNIKRINKFLGDSLDADKMKDVIDKSLYRQKI
jgi:uncharacterized membrane protein